jgi:acetyl-CoA acyltransferase
MKTAYSKHTEQPWEKAQRVFRFKRPDELAAETIKNTMNELPDFDKTVLTTLW